MLAHGRVAYTDAMGRTDIREAIAGHYSKAHGVVVDPRRVMITSGASAGFNIAFLAAFDVGARVAIASPGYPAYRNIMRALGIEPVEIAVGPADDYVLTADRLDAVYAEWPFQGVLIANPANPTGTMTSPEDFKAIVEFCERRGVRFISDEIYHRLGFGKPEVTALEFTQNAVVVNSFSKYYAMTGWRIGWAVLPEDLIEVSERIGQNLYISASEISQVAALAALGASEELDAVRETYRRNRERMIADLPGIGFRDIAPIDGAFYAYAAIPEGDWTATQFAKALLDESHVAVTPGIDFDPIGGGRFVRMSYACDEASLAEALERMGHFVARR